MWVIIACAGLLMFIHLGKRALAQKYNWYASPDGRFKVVIFSVPSLRFAMPGQGGDAPGFVQLIDTKTGRVLHERNVDMVQNIDQMDWSPDSVHIKLFADWVLPR